MSVQNSTWGRNGAQNNLYQALIHRTQTQGKQNKKNLKQPHVDEAQMTEYNPQSGSPEPVPNSLPFGTLTASWPR